MSCVVPQTPSLPVVAQPLIRPGARLPLVTTSVYGPAGTVTCAEPSAPAVTAAVPPCTVAPAAGSNVRRARVAGVERRDRVARRDGERDARLGGRRRGQQHRLVKAALAVGEGVVLRVEQDLVAVLNMDAASAVVGVVAVDVERPVAARAERVRLTQQRLDRVVVERVRAAPVATGGGIQRADRGVAVAVFVPSLLTDAGVVTDRRREDLRWPSISTETDAASAGLAVAASVKPPTRRPRICFFMLEPTLATRASSP